MLGAALCLASNASAGQRVSLLGFEGDSATAIRWRVAQILKRAGHVVIGFAPPRNPDSAADLRRYAKKRRVDVFVGGSAEEGQDGWELTLTVRAANGASMGNGLTFNAPTLGALVKELKADGQGKLNRVVQGRSTSRSKDVDLDADAEPSGEVAADESASEGEAWDADEPARAKQKKSKGKTKATKRKGKRASLERRAKDERRAVSEPMEEDSVLQRELRARQAKRRASSEPSDDAAADPLEGAAEITLDEDEPEEPKPKTKKRFGLSSWGRSDSASDETSSRSEPVAETSSEPESSTTDSAERSESVSFDEEGAASDESAPEEKEREVGADEETSEEPDSAGGARIPTAVFGVDVGMVRRDLDYSQDLYDRLRTPRTNALVYRIDAAFYPFARPVKDRIAVVAGYEAAFSGTVRDGEADAEFSVNFSELFGGVRLRQPIGKHEIGVSGTIGAMSAGLDDPAGAAGIPEFSYTVLNPQLDLGLDFGAIGVRTALGYRKTIGSFGEASEADWFPRMTGYGIDGELELEYRYSEAVAFELSGAMRRYVLEMNSRPQDAIDGESEVAGGAVDRYLSGYLGMKLTL